MPTSTIAGKGEEHLCATNKSMHLKKHVIHTCCMIPVCMYLWSIVLHPSKYHDTVSQWAKQKLNAENMTNKFQKIHPNFDVCLKCASPIWILTIRHKLSTIPLQNISKKRNPSQSPKSWSVMPWPRFDPSQSWNLNFGVRRNRCFKQIQVLLCVGTASLTLM